jgi:hypothetical protein
MSSRVKDTGVSTRRFGSELDVEAITGISRRTLQKNRLFATGFPFYKVGRRVLYDLNEVDAAIRDRRVEARTA